MTNKKPAPPEGAKACVHCGKVSAIDGCCLGAIEAMIERDRKPAPAAKPAKVETGRLRCGNVGCETPYQNVAHRWCQGTDKNGVKMGATLEASCEPCHLLDEADWAEKMMFETTGVPLPDKATRSDLLPKVRLTYVADELWGLLEDA